MKETFDFYSKTTLKSYNLDETMRYQLGLLNTLDAFTRRHSGNVASITCRLCEYLRLNKNFTVYCTICAYLHDIGKLFIPPEILQKPGALTDEEYEIMKTHTTIGYKMCMEDPKLKQFSAGPIYHHEALNGTGYPKGLTKQDIPIEGQIIRVADEFDAIVSKRQYKSHIGITDTLKLLIKDAQPEMTVPKSVALKTMKQSAYIGKINSKVLKALFKVVIDDTNYEISCVMDYTKYLQNQIERLEEINKLDLKMQKTNSQRKKEYYEESIKLMFEGGETFKNYIYVLEEYRTAKLQRTEIINNLFTEIKEIKKLRI